VKYKNYLACLEEYRVQSAGCRVQGAGCTVHGIVFDLGTCGEQIE